MTRTTLVAAFVAAWLLHPAGAPGRGPARTGLREGWERVVPVPDPLLGAGDRYVVWIERGWVHARRETAAGVVDWQVVLAEATDPEPPAVAAPEGTLRFEVSY